MVYNFGPGPAILPEVIKTQLKEAITDYNDTGISILELSHRSPEFINIINESKNLTLELMNLSEEEYEVLFLPGGSCSQFFMIPLNILSEDEKALYVISGLWTQYAYEQAERMYGDNIHKTNDPNLDNIDTSQYKYVYITSNDTAFGTQYEKNSYPKVKNSLLVADMCSDILSRDIDYSQFDIMHASVQKNLGVAGVTMIVIKKHLISDDTYIHLPDMLHYQKHAEKNSMYNTTPVFSVYSCLLVLRWLKQKGGMIEVEKNNIKKAQLLYNYLDTTHLFKPNILDKSKRSIMNITFSMESLEEEKNFIKYAKSKNIIGIVPYPAIGTGIRVSLYNGMPIGHVEQLLFVMRSYHSPI